MAQLAARADNAKILIRGKERAAQLHNSALKAVRRSPTQTSASG